MKNFILLFFAATLLCQGQIINFPDPNFKNELIYFRHSPVIDTNRDGEIQISEAEAFSSSIKVNNKNISDLTGIEYFINISGLYADDNNLTDVDLSYNTNLQFVILNNNNIASIDLGENPTLYNLEINHNELTTIDVSNNPGLIWLRASYNQLTDINLGNADLLGVLVVSYNQFTSLDVSQAQNLNGLGCDNNLLTDINFGLTSSIFEMSCSNNQLSELNINSDGSLWILRCNNNQLTDLTITSPPSMLVRLECKNNLFTELDLSTFRLKRLDCSENPLLENLNLRNGYNFEFDNDYSKFENLPNLTTVCLDSAYNQELIDFILTEVGHSVDFYNNETCDALSVNENNIGELTITPNPAENSINIEASTQINQIEIYNELGQLMQSKTINSTARQTDLNILALGQGLYFVKITDMSGYSTVKKVIKK